MNARKDHRIGPRVFVCGMLLLGTTAAARAGDSTYWTQQARTIAEQRLAVHRPVSSDDHDSSQVRLQDRPTIQSPARSARTDVIEVHSFSLAADAASRPGEEMAPATQPAEAAPIERGPLPSLGKTISRDLKEAPSVLWHDTKKTFGNPYNLVFLLGAGGASLALRPEVDDDIEDYYDEHHTFKPDWRDAFGAMGNPATHFGFAAIWYLLGQTTQDAKTYEVGKRAISALGITGITTVMLKLAACTESPNGEDWAWPSGHVSSTMALATVLNNAYGPLVGVPMFGLTGLVAVERLDSGEHHFSDVVFGAALGWVVAETVMKEHRPEIFGGQVVPYLDPVSRNAGVAWVKTLGD
jgi:membrane-associated phospholipid phosphatase